MEVSKEDLLDQRGEIDWQRCRAARLQLEVGDRILIKVSFEDGYGWGSRLSYEFWKEARIERATKTTVTADGITFMRERGMERGGKTHMALFGEREVSTTEQIEEGRKDMEMRRKVRRRAAEIANNIDNASYDRSRLKSLEDVQRVNGLLSQIEAIIGKSDKPRR